MLKLVLFFGLNVLTSLSWAFTGLQELEYSEHIESTFSTGRIVWLKAKDRKFLSLHTETEETNSSGAAIILHSMNGHPNQKDLINPLRTYLPQHNWATLSLQMPVLGIDADEEEYYPLFVEANARIQAGLDYLHSTKIENIAIIGYDLGSMMAAYFVKENRKSEDIKAIVTIGLSVPDSKQEEVKVIEFISEIKQPFLDIFFEHDLPSVTESARKRRIAGKANSVYRQDKIKGARQKTQTDDRLLVKRVYSWLNRTFR